MAPSIDLKHFWLLGNPRCERASVNRPHAAVTHVDLPHAIPSKLVGIISLLADFFLNLCLAFQTWYQGDTNKG